MTENVLKVVPRQYTAQQPLVVSELEEVNAGCYEDEGDKRLAAQLVFEAEHVGQILQSVQLVNCRTDRSMEVGGRMNGEI